MAFAGHNTVLTAATGSGASYESFNGAKSFTINDGRDLLDITDFADVDIRARLYGLRDFSVSVSGDYEPATSGTAWSNIQHQYLNGSPIFVKVLPTSTTGFMYELLVESFSISASVDGTAEVSVTMQANGKTPTLI